MALSKLFEELGNIVSETVFTQTYLHTVLEKKPQNTSKFSHQSLVYRLYVTACS